MQTNDAARRQAQWLMWQMGSVTVNGGETIHTPQPPVSEPQPEMRRSRYDAVIRRMHEAGQRTGAFTSWA